MFASLDALLRRHARPVVGMLMTALAVFLIIGVFGFGEPANAAGSNHAPNPQSGATATPDPGATDPLGNTINYLAFRDDELFLPSESCCSTSNYYTYFPETNLDFSADTALNTGAALLTSPYPQIFGARGRITTQEYDQAVYARRDEFSNVSVWIDDQSMSATGPQNSAYLSGLADRPGTENLTDLIAIDSADLDQLQDADGNNHDEVVVVYASTDSNNNYQPNVYVLDYTTTVPEFVPADSVNAATAEAIDSSLSNVIQTDSMVDVGLGDIDGDGQNEIVVAYLQNATTLRLDTYRYTNNSNYQQTLTLETSTAIPQPTDYDYYAGTISLGVGDLTGDNIAEIVIGYVGARDVSGASSHQAHGFSIYSADTSLDLTLVSAQLDDYAKIDHLAESPRIQIVLGMFRYDPTNGYDMGRNQVAMVHNNPDYLLEIETWDIATDLSISQLYGYSEIQVSMSSTCPQCYSVAAGDFRGVDYGLGPQWDLAYEIVDLDNSSNPYTLGLINVIDGNVISTAEPASLKAFANQRMPLVAYDQDGNSIFLGAPIHLEVDGQVTTDYIIYEPPKHTFYIESYSSVLGDYTAGEIVNVSRFPSFNVTLTENDTSSVTTTKTQTSDWSVGSSLDASASLTIKESASAGIAKESTSVTGSISASLAYSGNYSKTHTNSDYTSTSVTYSTTTNSDDSVGYTTQSMDIWRYRIYGATLPDGNPYYDYVIPGLTITNIGQEGTSLDWFQPLHENGNLLSYPEGVGGSYTPPDIGSMTTTSGTVTVPIIPSTAIGCCGNSGDVALSFNSTVQQGDTVSNSNTLSESLDSGLAYKAKVEAVGLSSTVKESVNVGVSNSNSWSTVKGNNKTTTVGDSITLELSSDSSSDESQAYTFYPVFHTTPDGTFKVSQGTGFDSDAGVGLWGNLYGLTPDAALNLPNRFYMNLGTTIPYWQPTVDDTRKTIRGFALLDGTLDPVTNEYDVLPDAPVSGEPIYVQFNVYNYSLGGIVNQVDTTLYNLDVLVEYAPYNGTDETGDRVTIGTTTVSEIAANGMVAVSVPWDTTGLGGSAACDTQEYRVIVTLDPNDTIAETYETEDSVTTYPYVIVDPVSGTITNSSIPTGVDPGQNNEGYAYATIQTPATSGDCDSGFDADVSVTNSSISGSMTANAKGVLKRPRRKKEPRQIRALKNVPVHLKIRVYSDKPHGLFGHLMIYDGNPNRKGRLIADKIVHFGATRGATATFDWVPRRQGKHKIFAVIIPYRDDPDKTNNVAKIKVNVLPIKQTSAPP